MDLQLFKQILSLDAQLYTYGYQPGTSKMWITTGTLFDQTKRKDENVAQRRFDHVKQILLDKTKKRFREHCHEKFIVECESFIEGKVWHSSFDPHTMVADIPYAKLQQP